MSERALQILQDAFPQLVEKFFTVTIPLTLMSFSLALIIAVIVAMIQYAHIKGLSPICRVLYLDCPRHTASGTAVPGLLRSAEHRHRSGCLSDGCSGLWHQ